MARARVLGALLLACSPPGSETGDVPDVTGVETSLTSTEMPTTSVGTVSTDTAPTVPTTTETEWTETIPETDASGTTTTQTSSTTEMATATDTTSTGDTESDTEEMCTFRCSPEHDQVLCGDEVVMTCAVGNYCVTDTCEELDECQAAALLQRSDGCEFWATMTGIHPDGAERCFAVVVANNGSEPAHLSVKFDGKGLPINNFTKHPKGQGLDIEYTDYNNAAGLPVGEVAIMFLSHNSVLKGCPVTPAVFGETHVTGTGRGHGFHITSDVPLAAYQILPYGGGPAAVTSASLLLPTSVWGTRYVAVSAGPKDKGEPLLTMVGQTPGTIVTLMPNVAVVGGNGIQGGPANKPLMYTLGRGETLQLVQAEELSGSIIESDHPIALFGGATCLNMPVNANACDSAHQQLPPIEALGHAYAAVRYRDRIVGNIEAPPWRIVGVAPDTQLTWLPAKPPDMPATIDRGQVLMFNHPGPLYVESQDADHPFYMSAYMTGGQHFNGAGDPEWVNLIPVTQFQRKYILFTDPTYPETELVIVRRRIDGGYADVTLGCTGPLTGWQTLSPELEWMRQPLVTGDFANVGACSNGRQELHSTQPFGVTVWGWGSKATKTLYTQYVSYAYPGGATIRPINMANLGPD